VYTLNKIVGFFCLLLSVQAAGQDLAAAKQLWAEKRIVAAREAIDNYLQENGNDDANGWLLKAAIYFAISSDLQLKSLVADGRMEAFTAIKKAVSLDGGLASGPAAKEIFTILPAIYQGYTTDGVAFYNAAVERQATVDYGHALSHFKKAMQVSDFYSTQGWKLLIAPSDSVLLYNAAQAAIHAGNEDEAILYCRKLADRKIYQAGAYSRQDFESIYQWLVKMGKICRNM
jgi:hypothetical protein